MEKNNIILVGFMGTGKSTVGKLLAKKTGLRFVDMDALIEKREQRTINEIFRTDGEPYFRALEYELAKELANQSGLVIATGGGIVLNPENIRAFKASGLVVCLTAATEEIVRRVATCSARPLLATDKEKQVRSLLKKRQPLYDALPFQVPTDGQSPQQITAKILHKFES
jgi:shikimate kinase